MRLPFRDRFEAGKVLARMLTHYAHDSAAIVLALPRGGVPVGFEVATKLSIPLEIFLVRKLGVPGHEEFAMGAIASTGNTFVNDEVVRQLGISRAEIDAVVRREERELKRRLENYGAEFSRNEIADKKVILVDDGLATGSSMRVAVKAVREKRPQKIIVAVPVASSETCAEFESEADEVFCAETPENFYAVGQWYENFSQTSDAEVRQLLARAREEIAAHVQEVLK